MHINKYKKEENCTFYEWFMHGSVGRDNDQKTGNELRRMRENGSRSKKCNNVETLCMYINGLVHISMYAYAYR